MTITNVQELKRRVEMIEAIKIRRNCFEETAIFFVNDFVSLPGGQVILSQNAEDLLERISATSGMLWFVPAGEELEISLLPWRNDDERPVFHEAYRIYGYGKQKIIIECIRNEDYYRDDLIEKHNSMDDLLKIFIG